MRLVEVIILDYMNSKRSIVGSYIDSAIISRLMRILKINLELYV
jgi:hypothetical protein